MPDHPPKPEAPSPGSFLEWLGRQVAHVSKAIETDVKPTNVIYRNDTVTEAPHPEDPNVKLRRTVIDEVVLEKTDGRIGSTKLTKPHEENSGEGPRIDTNEHE